METNPPIFDKKSWIFATLLTSILTAGAVAAAWVNGHGGFPLVITAFVFFLVMGPYCAFALTNGGQFLRDWLSKSPAKVLWMPVITCALYIIYALGTDCLNPSSFLRLLAFVLFPTLLTYGARHGKYPKIFDFAAIFLIWIPFDTGWLASIWSWPKGEGAYIINTCIAVDLAMILFFCLRGTDGLSLRFIISGREAITALCCLFSFLALALPFAFYSDFIAWNPKLNGLGETLATPLGILFFIAIPEELLFRGLVLNSLQKILASPQKALILSALIFGLTHLNNEPMGDWRYVILASVAGIFYGISYQKSRSLLAPALVHMMVDTLWVLFFLKN